MRKYIAIVAVALCAVALCAVAINAKISSINPSDSHSLNSALKGNLECSVNL